MTETENEKAAPRVKRLEDLVAYQDGSVVSREIIHKSTGTATIFAFDIGQGLSEHTAPFDALRASPMPSRQSADSRCCW